MQRQEEESPMKHLGNVSRVSGLVVSLWLLVCVTAASAEAPYQLAWTRQIGTPFYDFARGAAVDSAGNVYLGGRTGGSLGGPNLGDQDALLIRYNADGALAWVRQM
jgi:hypothetical protein